MRAPEQVGFLNVVLNLPGDCSIACGSFAITGHTVPLANSDLSQSEIGSDNP